MELYHLAVLLCLALFVRDGSAVEKTNGQTCTESGDTCAATHHCDGTCKWKIGGDCTADSLACVGDPCTAGNKCACPTSSDYTAYSDDTYCVYSGVGTLTPGSSGCKAADLISKPGEKCDAKGACDTNGNCVIKADGEAERGAACKAVPAKVEEKCKEPGDKCEDGICFIPDVGTSDGSCDAIPTDAGKKCPSTETCIDKKCKKRVDQPCTAKSTDECLPNASCKSDGSNDKCVCNAEHKANTYKTSCDKSGSAGMAASLLLVVSAFLTSRFL